MTQRVWVTDTRRCTYTSTTWHACQETGPWYAPSCIAQSGLEIYAARVALPHAILVSLCEQSGSGYELARRFDRSIGYFWAATHQQIYRTLRAMEDDGWVHVTPVAQQGRPDKKVYTVSDSGRAELARWIAEPLSAAWQLGGRQPHPRSWRSRFAAPRTATSTRCAHRWPRCAPNAPNCWTLTADSRSGSFPTPAACSGSAPASIPGAARRHPCRGKRHRLARRSGRRPWRGDA